MEINDTTPAELVSRIRSGERSAEDELVRRYSRGVSFVIRQSISDNSLAEDIYQDSFRLVLEKVRAGEVRDPDRLSGFVCSLVRNLVLDQFRKASRRSERQPQDFEQPIASSEPSQLDQLLRQEQGNLARQILAALPSDRDRKVLYRFYIADDDKEDICADLGITSLHFNQILCRARERYKKLYEQTQEKRKVD
jgi:RNA polymerase sigma-70 factor, ECF subfamily